jgi:hypothetical protein
MVNVTILVGVFAGRTATARPAFGRDRWHVEIDGCDYLYFDSEHDSELLFSPPRRVRSHWPEVYS